MADKNREGLKQKLLLGFVGLGIILIAAVWTEGLSEPKADLPGYYRDSYQVSDAVFITATAEAAEYLRSGTPTPGVEEHGQGRGRNHKANADADH